MDNISFPFFSVTGSVSGVGYFFLTFKLKAMKEPVKTITKNFYGKITPEVSNLSSKHLYGLLLIPREKNMPEWVKKYLIKAEREFYNRSDKLIPICK